MLMLKAVYTPTIAVRLGLGWGWVGQINNIDLYRSIFLGADPSSLTPLMYVIMFVKLKQINK